MTSSTVVLLLACLAGAPQRRFGALGFSAPTPPTTTSAAAAPKAKAPKVSAPAGFSAPEPKPLTATGDFQSLLTGSAALALRAATGILVTGWRPRLSLTKPAADERMPISKEYALKLGPLYLMDSSATLRQEVKRPKETIVLYEYDASPFCKKVREACAILDLDVLMKPCPGARKGFSDELAELSGGKRTVPCLVDPNRVESDGRTGVPLFESDDIIDHLYDAYGPGKDEVPLTLKGFFATLTCGLAAAVRGMPAATVPAGARPDNGQMEPLTLYGYEPSPFVKPGKFLHTIDIVRGWLVAHSFFLFLSFFLSFFLSLSCSLVCFLALTTHWSQCGRSSARWACRTWW